MYRYIKERIWICSGGSFSFRVSSLAALFEWKHLSIREKIYEFAEMSQLRTLDDIDSDRKFEREATKLPEASVLIDGLHDKSN